MHNEADGWSVFHIERVLDRGWVYCTGPDGATGMLVVESKNPGKRVGRRKIPIKLLKQRTDHRGKVSHYSSNNVIKFLRMSKQRCNMK